MATMLLPAAAPRATTLVSVGTEDVGGGVWRTLAGAGLAAHGGRRAVVETREQARGPTRRGGLSFVGHLNGVKRPKRVCIVTLK